MKAVIFDLDGVLVFTDKFHFKAWKALADELGIYFDEAINNRLRGVSRMESLEIVLERSDKTYTEKEKLAFAAKKNEIYCGYLTAMTENDVTEEVRCTLTKLKEKGYKIAVGSSSKNAKLILEKVKLLDVFDKIADGNDIQKSKPDPEVFLKAAEFLGVEPESCYVVEDAEAGVIAGNRANMKTIATGDAKQSKLANYEIQKFSDILNIV